MWPYWLLILLLAIGLTSWLWKRRSDRLADALVRAKRESDRLWGELQQARQGSQARELAVFSSMVEGVLLLDSDGRVRFSNQALDSLFGIQQDIRGRTVLEAFRLEGMQHVLQRVFDDGQLLNYELDLPGPESKCVQINATALLDQRMHREGIVMVCRDLTRLKQLEDTRREFVANVSHELRTPLSMIKGYAETLLHGAKDDPAVALKFLNTIEKHADRLTYLIEDLLTVSRLESGQIVMNIQPVELHSTVAEVLTDLDLRAVEKGARMKNDVPPDLKVKADADRLQQVIFNLVDNALKYGATNGGVRIASRRLDGERVEVSVRDDGPGIPPSGLHRIFERFYRVDRARSREQGGTGLGLAIVKHIVQFHGGEVWAESEPQQGTTLFFTLPLA